MSIQSIPPLIALTCDSDTSIEMAELAQAAAALQKQVTRDFAPVWGQSATLAAFPSPDDVPPGYWPMLVKTDIGDSGALGFHLDEHHQPAALIEATQGWETTASHELLEMLADPWGSRLVVCDDPQGTDNRVRVLVEACDPCEAFTYSVDGIALSDFVLPAFYGPHRWRYVGASPGAPGQLSFTGALAKPLSIAPGGYLSWMQPDHTWHQATWFSGDEPAFRELGRHTQDGQNTRSLREWIDQNASDARNHIGSRRFSASFGLAGAPG